MAEGGNEENDKYTPQISAPRRREYKEEEEKSPKYDEKIRIILVGKTGNGKSAVGNSILGYDGFTSDLSGSSITQKGDIKQMIWDDKVVIEVVDTPGFFDTELSVDKVALEIIQSFGMIAPGPHVILYVLKCGEKLTDEEEKTLKEFNEIFSGEAKKFMITCFTRKDSLKNKSPDEFLRDVPKWVKDFIASLEQRTFFMDNTLENNENQWIELYDTIKPVVTKNKGKHYTNDILSEVTEKIELQIVEADKNLSIFRRKYAMMKRNIACKGSILDYLVVGILGGGTGAAVGAVVGGVFFANPILGAYIGAGGGQMSCVTKAIIRMKRKKEGYGCVLS